VLGLLAGAWWPWRTERLLGPLQGHCHTDTGALCTALAQAHSQLHLQGLGLQALLMASAVWLVAMLWRTAPKAGAAGDAGLAMLREVGRLFGEGPVNGPVLLRSLAPLQRALATRTVALWLDERPRRALGCAPLLCSQGAPLVTWDELEAPLTQHPGGVRLLPPAGPSKGFVLTVPLTRERESLGLLVVECEPGQAVDEALLQRAELYAALASLAVAAVCSGQEERRLALMEERGAIAAELHDSLAQSLAYMKIQVAQLQRGLDGAALPPEAIATAATARDLRNGLSNAYRAVRELIAAFRVRMGPGGLRAAVQDTVDELAQRSGVDIAFDESLARCPLGVNEEFHVMQVIREALSNTVRHAGATRAWVSIQPVDHRLEVTVDDDGRGLGGGDPQDAHHGLGIMRERARSLGGSLEVLPRPGGGTRVRLCFVPHSLPGDEAAA